MAQATTSQQQPTSLRSLTTHLPPFTFTCFTDAVWQATTQRAGCGWIFYTQQGERLDQGTSMFEHTSTPKMAEGLAIRSALLHALEAGYTRICIKSDCQVLVATISSKNHPQISTESPGTSSIYPFLLNSLSFLLYRET